MSFSFKETEIPGRRASRRGRLPDEQALLRRILHNYDTSARPVYNASHTVTVKFGFTLAQIADMVTIVTK